MEELKKENILKRFLNYIKAGWDRLGEPDIDDEEVELTDELKDPIQAESMFTSSKDSTKWKVDERDITPLEHKSNKTKNKQASQEIVRE